jgi:hypothetical protein
MNAAAARKRAGEAAGAGRDLLPQGREVRRMVVGYSRVEDYVREIQQLWGEAAESFLLIGRWLNKAKESLDHGDYLTMVERDLPFSASRAYQLRAVAAMVDVGRVAEEDLPRASATAYIFTVMDPATLLLAKKDGVLRADVQRKEVLAWRDRVCGAQMDPIERSRRRRLLQARIERWRDEIARAESLLAELDDAPLIEGSAAPDAEGDLDITETSPVAPQADPNKVAGDQD